LNNKKEIVISPTTRIEGHGKVTIVLDDQQNVSNAYFHATEIRGFEYFLRGMNAEKIPFIVSRICGVCSTAHIIASVKAIENAFKTEITETARKLRELLLMGQIISNHSLVFFFLNLPDYWFSLKEDPSKKNIFQIMRETPEIGKKAIQLRTFGTHLLRLIGRREIHIVSVIPGGLIKGINEKERQILLKKAKEAVELGKELFERRINEISTSEKLETCYMGLNKNDNLEYYSGKINLINEKGNLLTKFDEYNFMDQIGEKTYGWTYAKFAYYKKFGWPKGVIQVGPTARMNISKRISTSSANKELSIFKRNYGDPAHLTMLFDYSRLIELLYACERVTQILREDEITRKRTRVPIKIKAGKGVGVVEAPRGTLFHKYVLNKTGNLKIVKFIIPTQINNAAINMSVKSAATKYIKNGKVKPGLLNSIEVLIRAYDTCIKCATRTINEGLKIEFRNKKNKLLKTIENN
jgi:coenzyme F420-reducing hydrogenase alpha subunit